MKQTMSRPTTSRGNCLDPSSFRRSDSPLHILIFSNRVNPNTTSLGLTVISNGQRAASSHLTGPHASQPHGIPQAWQNNVRNQSIMSACMPPLCANVCSTSCPGNGFLFEKSISRETTRLRRADPTAPPGNTVSSDAWTRPMRVANVPVKGVPSRP